MRALWKGLCGSLSLPTWTPKAAVELETGLTPLACFTYHIEDCPRPVLVAPVKELRPQHWPRATILPSSFICIIPHFLRVYARVLNSIHFHSPLECAYAFNLITLHSLLVSARVRKRPEAREEGVRKRQRLLEGAECAHVYTIGSRSHEGARESQRLAVIENDLGKKGKPRLVNGAQ